jgi:Tfp pilus assembly protein FimV
VPREPAPVHVRQVAPAPPAPRAQPAPAPVAAAYPPSEPHAHHAGGPRHGGWYAVEPGDSLWSIASALAGHDASPATIAETVDALWSLNRDRIASGQPDLIAVGERLRLP